jgi:hypothetical protein
MGLGEIALFGERPNGFGIMWSAHGPRFWVNPANFWWSGAGFRLELFKILCYFHWVNLSLGPGNS